MNLTGSQGCLVACPVLDRGEVDPLKVADVGGDDGHAGGVGDGSDPTVLGTDAFDGSGERLKDLLGFGSVGQELKLPQKMKEIQQFLIESYYSWLEPIFLNLSQRYAHDFFNSDSTNIQIDWNLTQDPLPQ